MPRVRDDADDRDGAVAAPPPPATPWPARRPLRRSAAGPSRLECGRLHVEQGMRLLARCHVSQVERRGHLGPRRPPGDAQGGELRHPSRIARGALRGSNEKIWTLIGPPGDRCSSAQMASMNEGPLSSPAARFSASWWAGGLVVVWSGAHVSIASSTSRTWCYRGSLRWRMSKMDCQAVRRFMAPAGAKGLNGWLRVSMYQIASVSLRASSIWATFAPAWRPRRRLVRW
jgi:hypothetical protein